MELDKYLFTPTERLEIIDRALEQYKFGLALHRQMVEEVEKNYFDAYLRGSALGTAWIATHMQAILDEVDAMFGHVTTQGAIAAGTYAPRLVGGWSFTSAALANASPRTTITLTGASGTGFGTFDQGDVVEVTKCADTTNEGLKFEVYSSAAAVLTLAAAGDSPPWDCATAFETENAADTSICITVKGRDP